MKKLLVCLSFLTIAFSAKAYRDYPKFVGYINDYAKVLQPKQSLDLASELVAFDHKNGINICLVTITSLQGQSIDEYATGLAVSWIQQISLNNMVIFVVDASTGKNRTALILNTPDSITAAINVLKLPAISKKNMAAQTIDDMHFIINAYDVAQKTQRPLTTTEAISESKQFYNDKRFTTVAISIVIIVAVVIVIIKPLRQRNAKKDFFASIGDYDKELNAAITESRKGATDSDPRYNLNVLKKETQDLIFISEFSHVDSWVMLNKRLHAAYEKLDYLIRQLNGDIDETNLSKENLDDE